MPETILVDAPSNKSNVSDKEKPNFVFANPLSKCNRQQSQFVKVVNVVIVFVALFNATCNTKFVFEGTDYGA